MDAVNTSMQEKLAKRGYAYQCLLCDGYMADKRYVESHIYKNHLPESVPYSCNLCPFIAKTERERGLKAC
jgi:hypothetical protein